MTFGWRRFIIFGFAASIPVVTWLVKKDIEKTIFEHHQASMAACETCHRLFTGKAGPKWIAHLVDAHKMDDDTAIDTVADIYKRWIKQRHKKEV